MFYTAQQTSVHSVHSVVKNDSVADLPHRRGGEGEENSHGMPKFFSGRYTDMRYAVWYNIRC